MPKRAKTLDSLLLALEMLKRIPKTGRISARDLQRQLAELGFKRDLRSIQRQLSELSEHLDIERDDRERPYGYRWLPKAQGFVVPGLNAQESLLLTLAEKHLRELLPPNLLNSMEGFFAQAKRNLAPGSKPSRDREWLSKVRIIRSTPPLLPAQVSEAVFAEVSAALYNNRQLEVTYRNAAGHQGEYTVHPLGLAQQGPGLYLVCRFAGHDNERTLALHRIQKARATTLTAKRPPNFNLDKYVEDGRFGFGEGKRIRLSFVIDKGAGAHLLETPLSTDQKAQDQGDTYKITATVVDTAQLDWWLNGFGDNIRDIRRTRPHRRQ